MPSPREDLENELASHPERVLLLVGAGVARATDENPCATWPGLLKNGLQRCRDRCHGLSPKWVEITELSIDQNTADELIQAASRIEKALRGIHGGEYGRWLRDSVGSLRLSDRRTVDAILSWGVRVATTNYDNLFEDAGKLPAVVWEQGDYALEVLRGDRSGILHLHGHYLHAESVVFSAGKYEDICRDVRAQNFLRSIFTRDTVVFVGCGAGVDDPNFGGLMEWSRQALENCLHTHYHLVRKSELESVRKRYQGLQITPIAYGENYGDLAPFLEQVSERALSQSQTPTPLVSLVARQADYDTQLRELNSQSDVPPLEYVRRSFELMRNHWSAGGHRTAALHMGEVITSLGEKLPDADRMNFAVEAADFLIQDGLHAHALTLLSSLQAVVPNVGADPGVQTRFRQLLARCLSEAADLANLEKIVVGMLQTASPEERSRLEAERAENLLLTGDLARAESDLGLGATS